MNAREANELASRKAEEKSMELRFEFQAEIEAIVEALLSSVENAASAGKFDCEVECPEGWGNLQQEIIAEMRLKGFKCWRNEHEAGKSKVVVTWFNSDLN